MFARDHIEIAGRRVPGHATSTGLWVSEAPIEDAGAAWLTLLREPVEPGLTAVLLDESDGPWVEDDEWFEPGYLASDTDADVEATLRSWWEEVRPDEDVDEGDDAAMEIAPYGREFPGLAPVTSTAVAEARLQRAIVDLRGFRLALVAGETTADVPGTLGWLGAVNVDESPSGMSTVLRSWDQRFGARLVVLGRDTMDLFVARPPATLDEALPIAAEHYSFCFDNISQGSGSIRAYANALVALVRWPFWWD